MWRWPLAEPIDLPDPAAGAGFGYSIGNRSGERIEAVTFELVTAVAVANRIPVVTFLDEQGVALTAAGAPFTLSAAKTCLYSFFVGGNQYGANDAAHIGGPLPDVWLSRRFSVAVTVSAIAAADQISDVRLVVTRAPDYEAEREGE